MVIRIKKTSWHFKYQIMYIIFLFAIFTRIIGNVALWAVGLGIITILISILNLSYVGWAIKNTLPFIAVLMPMTLITIFNYIEGVASVTAVYRLITFWLLYFIGVVIANYGTDEYLEKSYFLVYRVGIIFAIYGLVEWIIKDNYLIPYLSQFYAYSTVGTSSYRISSVFVHPIVCANVLLIMLIVNIYRNCTYKSRYAGYLILMLSLFATSTRGAWILAAQILLIELIDNYRTKISRRTLMVIALTMVIVLVSAISSNSFIAMIIERFSQLGGSYSLSYRLGIITNYFKATFSSNVFNIIFGHGYFSARGSLEEISSVRFNVESLDNQFISLLYDGGLLIFTALIILLIYCLIFFFKSNNKTDKMLLLMIIISMEEMFFYENINWQVSVMFLIVPIAIYLSRGKLKAGD